MKMRMLLWISGILSMSEMRDRCFDFQIKVTTKRSDKHYLNDPTSLVELQ